MLLGGNFTQQFPLNATVRNSSARRRSCTGWHHFSCQNHAQNHHPSFMLKLIKHFFALFYKHIVCSLSLQCLLCSQIYGEFFMMFVGDEMVLVVLLFSVSLCHRFRLLCAQTDNGIKLEGQMAVRAQPNKQHSKHLVSQPIMLSAKASLTKPLLCHRRHRASTTRKV